MVDRQPCDLCRSAFIPNRWDTPADELRKKYGPPCSTCKPNVHPVNVRALEVFGFCRNQVIVSGLGEVIGMNITAVKTVMDLNGIKNQKDCLEKVMFLSEKIIGMQNETRNS